MNPAKPTHSTSGLEALTAQRLLDSRQVGLSSSEERGFASLLKTAQQQSLPAPAPQPLPRAAAAQAEARPWPQTEPRQSSKIEGIVDERRAEPARLPPQEPARTTQHPPSPPAAPTQGGTQASSAKESGTEEPAEEPKPDSLQAPKVKPRSVAQAPVAAALPAPAGLAPEALADLPLGRAAEATLAAEPFALEEPAPAQDAAVDKALLSDQMLVKPLPPAGTAAQADSAPPPDAQGISPGIQAPSSTLYAEIPGRTTASLKIESSQIGSPKVTSASQSDTAKAADTKKPLAVQEELASGAPQRLAALTPAPTTAAPAVSVNAPTRSQAGAAEIPIEAPLTKGRFGLASWATSTAPDAMASPTSNALSAGPTPVADLASIAAATASTSVLAPVESQANAAESPTVKSSFSLAGWASSPAPGVTASPTNSSTQATVAAPVNSPGFADELGAQVAIWSRHGVQEAELRMNPAEMGPVQVRIQVDGQVAQVRFVAEQALTREALQAALPQLAQALAAEGLQWGGGDVQPQMQHNTQQPMQHSAQQNMQQQGQQQAQQQGQQQAEGQRGGGGRRQWQSATELGNEARGAPKQPGQRVGLLDLYA